MSQKGGGRLPGFPSPDELSAYERLYPGFTKAFLENWTAESDHRRRLDIGRAKDDSDDRAAERADLTAERIERRRGQFCALAIGIIAIVAGATVAVLNRESTGAWAGGVIGGGGVIGLVAVFVLGRPAGQGSELGSGQPAAELGES